MTPGQKIYQEEAWIKCERCNDTGWVCENHPGREAHKCPCGGAGMPCECNTADPPWDFDSLSRVSTHRVQTMKIILIVLLACALTGCIRPGQLKVEGPITGVTNEKVT